MMFQLARRLPSPGMAVALVALFVALDGPAAAKRLLIDGGSIKSNSVTGKQIRNRSLGTGELTRGAVQSLQRTPNASVTAVKIGPKAVDASKIADSAVGTAALAAGAVTDAKIAASAVGPGQLAAGAVTSGKLAESSVGGMAIANGTLSTADLGQFAGSIQTKFQQFEPGDCQVAPVSNPQPTSGVLPNVADDIVAVSPAPGWPDPLVLSGYPGAGNTIRIVACYVAKAGSAAIELPPTIIRYVTFDAP
jgi:hypothetical protein